MPNPLNMMLLSCSREIASTFVGESIPVIVRDTGEMLGVVTEGDIFGLYLSTQNRITDLERSWQPYI